MSSSQTFASDFHSLTRAAISPTRVRAFTFMRPSARVVK